ncbi:hypothetical protein G6F43_011720 [Rhizopus delemar]|nr:hypothetical protein G6F43_011720 [Rhizopus delemar]
MPPGSTNPTNSTTLISNLNPEEITDLLSKFETCRKILACPHCAKRGVFRRNGSTKTEPPQPIFRCSGCGVSFRDASMRSIVLSLLSTSSQLSPMEENCEISRTSMETPNPHTEDLQTLLNMVHRLTNELAVASSKIEQLRVTTLQLQGQLNKKHSSSSQHATLSTTNTPYSIDFSDLTSASPPWRNPDQIRHIKENLMQE